MYKKYTTPLPSYGMWEGRKTSWDGPANKKILQAIIAFLQKNSFSTNCWTKHLCQQTYWLLFPCECQSFIYQLYLGAQHALNFHPLFMLRVKKRQIGKQISVFIFGRCQLKCVLFGPRLVWLELAKFCHFVISCQVLGKLFMLYFLFGKMLSLLYGANFQCCKWPNNEK